MRTQLQNNEEFELFVMANKRFQFALRDADDNDDVSGTASVGAAAALALLPKSSTPVATAVKPNKRKQQHQEIQDEFPEVIFEESSEEKDIQPSKKRRRHNPFIDDEAIEN